MVSLVQVATPGCQQFHRLPDPRGLVDAALFADGQVHGEVKEWVFLFSLARFAHLGQCGIHVRQFVVVLGVFGNPLASEHFDGFHRLLRALFRQDTTEKAPYIGLRRTEHGAIVAQLVSDVLGQGCRTG